MVTLPQAQAQEVLWEKEELIGLRDDDIIALIDYAHRTKSVSDIGLVLTGPAQRDYRLSNTVFSWPQVADCYHPIRELLEAEAVKEYLPDCWMSIIKASHAHLATPIRHVHSPSDVFCSLHLPRSRMLTTRLSPTTMLP